MKDGCIVLLTSRLLCRYLFTLDERVPGVGDRAEQDQHEAEDNEQRRERKRLALFFRRRPANPALQRKGAPALKSKTAG